jgi:uncharacterized protein
MKIRFEKMDKDGAEKEETSGTTQANSQPSYSDEEDTPCAHHACPAPCCRDFEIQLLNEDVERLESAGHPKDTFMEFEDNDLYLRKTTSGCVFQQGPVCTVHPHRPLACRTFPFILPESDGDIQREESCPHNNEFEDIGGGGDGTDDRGGAREFGDLKETLQYIITTQEREQEIRNICAINKCDVCCCNTEMPLTNGDMKRILDLGHRDFYRKRRGEHILKNIDHRCFFLLGDGRCTIYEDRPEGCRFYPFILGKGGVVMDEDCPQREVFQPRFAQWIEDGLMELVSRLEEERAKRLGKKVREID